MLSFALGTLIGCHALTAFSTLPQFIYLAAAFLASLVFLALSIWLTKAKILRIGALFVVGLVLGLGWTTWHAQQKLSWHLPTMSPYAWVKVSGTVTGITQLKENNLRFDLTLTTFADKPVVAQVPVKIRLHWRKASEHLVDGDTIHAVVCLKNPWDLANPGTASQSKQWFIEGIRALGQVIQMDGIQRAPRRTLTAWRQFLNSEIARHLNDQFLLGVIQATTLGIYANIPPEQWQVFQTTGTSHAIAISGMHVGMVAMLCAVLVTFMARRFHGLTQLFPAANYGATAGMLAALAYSAIAGFSIPTQRSLIMCVVGLCAQLTGRRILSWQSLALGWLGIALIDPQATLQVGFWLSFACMAALIYGQLHSKGAWWKKHIVPQALVFVGLLPMSILFFQQVNLYSMLANFITLPLISFIVIPLSLLGVALIPLNDFLAQALLILAHDILLLAWWILQHMAQWPYSRFFVQSHDTSTLVLAFLGGILLLAPKGFPLRYFGLLYVVPLLLQRELPLAVGTCRFTLLDVGQGLAAVIQTRHHVLLYDAGPRYSRNLDAGNRVIIPFLQAQGISHLDRVIISHYDLDHRAGLPRLQNWIQGDILSSEASQVGGSRPCVAGQQWMWDGVHFQMLHPKDANAPNQHRKWRNDRSCVLRVRVGKQSVLLTGDIEKVSEGQLIDSNKKLLRSTILVVPHHGSLTSSSEEFVKAVAPKYALYAAGYANTYRLPKSDILQRYAQIGSQNRCVWQTGAISFQLNGQDELTPPTYWRETSSHYWQIPRTQGEQGD